MFGLRCYQPASSTRQWILRGTFYRSIRIINKLKAKSASVLRLALRRMYHSSFGVCTRLLELLVKCVVLNRGFAGVLLALWFSLGCISR